MVNEDDSKLFEDSDPSKNTETSSQSIPGVSSDSGKQWASNFSTSASPPKFVSLEEIMQAANGMKNMALAHEIAVDNNFQLQKLEPGDDSIQKKVKEIMHRAFWNVLAEQLMEDPPNYTHALVLLHEIYFQHYSHYVLSIMAKVCAPVRDDRIHDLTQCTDVVKTFKGIMETIQLMRLDLANFTISMMRPNIVASSIEYEKTKFAEFLKVQADGLAYTRRWLLKHLTDEKIKAAAGDTNGINHITHFLLGEAYLDLLNWDSSPEAETLMLDQGRLLELRDKVNRLTIVGSVLLLCGNTIGAAVQGLADFKKNIKEHLDVLLDSIHSNKMLREVMPNIVIQINQDIKMTLNKIGAPELTQSVEAILKGQIMDLVNEDHKIRHLVNLRIRQFLQKIILSKNTVHTQVPPGLSSLQEELAAIAARFFILVAHNRSVFSEYYQEIITTEIAKRNLTLRSSEPEADSMDV
ncbi:T-complex protein 11-like protein 1 isoform X2 [Aphidius gifuensis]|uniref:T-complex protein 11-like protein 1 isoform X2 n=1 Tax=Aphidius gifuensis TaxID=684658 RepID=UPI001CDC8C64|nr:T-complex protein 11-like protein 1 isoform X2 [Aphidius gifuensis]